MNELESKRLREISEELLGLAQGSTSTLCSSGGSIILPPMPKKKTTRKAVPYKKANKKSNKKSNKKARKGRV